ncbi:LPD29 domain-containing protein [Vibrio sp. D431a]|uniref:LPD29 domain-containing protein n=1 Tax=Vibrio sp. D431a TaxID=2837388 RepID=UPI0025568FA4|nr:LPD29 domain-containing protein [Vibrio sp. D431a]MDK9793796.1 hypothetical protein [Vibrio sp. D431a]
MTNVSNELLQKRYPHLELLGAQHDSKAVAKNVRKHLKTLFPKSKISVKSKIGQIDISWTDGQTNQSIENAINPFKKATFEGSVDDSFAFHSTAFNDAFGGVKLITLTRDHSKTAKQEAIEELSSRLKNEYPELTLENYEEGKLIDIYPEGEDESLSTLIRKSIFEKSYT